MVNEESGDIEDSGEDNESGRMGKDDTPKQDIGLDNDETEITTDIYIVPIEVYVLKPEHVNSKVYTPQLLEDTIFVETNDPTVVMRQVKSYPDYWRNYNEASDRAKKRLPPFRIDEKREIVIAPRCTLRYRNYEGEYTCGRPIHSISKHPEKDDPEANLDGEFGTCILDKGERLDYPGCPFSPPCTLEVEKAKKTLKLE